MPRDYKLYLHGYFVVNLPIIWNIVEIEITSLREQIEVLLKDMDE